MNKAASIFINLFIYVIALFVVIFTWPYIPEYHLLWKILIADVIGTVAVFIFSVIFNNSSMYDPYWSVQPFVIAVFLAWPLQGVTLAEALVLLMVFLYGLRLTLNFYRGWPGMKHEDWRYQDFRKSFPKLYWVVSLLGIHLFPTLMVFLACMSMVQIFQGPGMTLDAWYILGLITMILAVGLAFIADEQMKKFRMKPENKGKLMRQGLWKYSRHPNYLGEILTWWGLFFFSLSAGMDQWWMGVGALTVTIMFVFISIPMLEKREIIRRPEYADYKKEVPMLLPIKIG
jgi:steroid 5-alpha reductase family enzyme